MHIIKAQWEHIVELVVAVEQGLAPAARALQERGTPFLFHCKRHPNSELARCRSEI